MEKADEQKEEVDKDDETGPPMETSDPVTDFLNKIGPDWDAAIAHGEANLVLRNTVLNFDDKSSYCQCCMMPFPDTDPEISKGSENSNYYPLCTDTKNLGEMGPGYPMFLELIKQIGLTMLILAIIYFIPAAVLIYKSYEEIKAKVKLGPSDSPFSLFTFGALLRNNKEIKMLTKDGKEITANAKTAMTTVLARPESMQAILVILFVTVIVTYLWLVYLRKKLLEKSIQLDAEVYSPSDFCLMGRNMKFHNYNPDEIEKAIKEEFKLNYEIDDVIYVNPVYDIADFYEIFNKQNELMKLKLLMEGHSQDYMKEHNCDEEQYNKLMKDPSTCPKDCPKLKTGLIKKEFIPLDGIKDRLKEIQNQISAKEKTAYGDDNDDDQDRKEAFTGIVFVVMNQPKDVATVLKRQQQKCCGSFMRLFCPCCFCSSNISRSWVFERAPEPTDIFWENMNVHICKKIFNIVISLVATFIIMLISFGLISWIKSYKNQFSEDFKKTTKGHKVSLYETGASKLMSWSASLAVVIVNELLLFVMRKLSRAEK